MSYDLARKFIVQATTDLTLAGGWLAIGAISDFDPNLSPNMEDAGNYSSNGLPAMEVTAWDAAPTASFLRQTVGGVHDPGQEIIRTRIGQFGDSVRHGLRWFDRNGGPETGSAIVIPSWKRAATNYKNIESISCTFQVTDGTLNLNFANPGTATTVPLVVTASPSAQGAGKIITLTGASFTGTTGITIGGVAVVAGAFTVESDSVLVFVVPAGSAGSAPIIVTNAAGAGAAFPYTRGT